MEKYNKNSSKIIRAKQDYSSIQHSRVSWRKKSSYKKPIKRWASKLSRTGAKSVINRELESD